MGSKAERAQGLLWELQDAYNDMDRILQELRLLGYPLEQEDRQTWDGLWYTLQDLGNEIVEDMAAEEDERREEEEHDEAEED